MLLNAAMDSCHPQIVQRILLGYFMGLPVYAKPRDTLFNLLLLRPADIVVLPEVGDGTPRVVDDKENGMDPPQIPDLESISACRKR